MDVQADRNPLLSPDSMFRLQDFLVLQTRLTVAVTQADGICLRYVDFVEGEISPHSGKAIPVCKASGTAQAARHGEDMDRNQACAFPVAGFVLMISAGARDRREREYKEKLKQVLSQIATITNGEAILFDDKGTLGHTSLPNGKPSPNAGGEHPQLAELLKTWTPEIATSRWVPGATAVRLPLTPDMGLAFNNALSVQFGRELATKATDARTAYSWENIIGRSSAMRDVRRIGELAASSRAPVVIHGESGTGKELLAQAIHDSSERKNQPFLSVNCGALTPTLIESLLFGYVDGAFTGARRGGQLGLFERAHRGTLLLDEISEMEIDLQVKLLRVIQEEEVVPVGGHNPRKIDVRLVCTSNRDLKKMVQAGKFRHDLYFRLNVLDIELPPLRERHTDIPLLVDYLLEKIASRNATPLCQVTPSAMRALTAYSWPGNIRELQNALERASTISESTSIETRHLPASLAPVAANEIAEVPPLEHWITEARAKAANAALLAANGNKAKAARMLRVSPATYWRLLRGS